MSIKVMTYVWDNSPSKGSELLVLLALADMATDEGVCWPSINTLAKKSRLASRYVWDLVNRLVKSGQLEKIGEAGEKYKHSVIYRIPMMRASYEAGIMYEAGIIEPTRPASYNTSLTRQLVAVDVKGENEILERPNIFSLYESALGPLTPTMANILMDAEKEYPQHWLEAAFEETAKANGRSWSYTNKILQSWQRNGFQADTRGKARKKPVKEEHFWEEHS